MVVMRKEKSDVKYEKTADLKIGGKMFVQQPVYGNKNKPRRRDIFITNDVRKEFKKLPKQGKADWSGKRYTARLSFRFGRGGRRIPVYEFRLKKS